MVDDVGALNHMDLAKKVVVGLGEVLWDCFPDGRRLGGAPANVAYHADRLGQRGVVCSRVGKDEWGRELRAELQRRNLDTSYLQTDDARPTGTVTVDASDPQSPRYTIAEDVAWDHLQYDESLQELAAKADAVCFGTLAQRTAVNQETIHRFLNAATNALIVFDVNLRKSPYPEALLKRSLRAAAVVKLNEAEAMILSQMLRLPENLPDFAEALLHRYAVRVLCITQGVRGCSLYSLEERHHLPGISVQVVDAVGAGDAFTAGLVTGLVCGWPLETCGRLANQMGALVAGQAGAMPEIDSEARDVFQALQSRGEQVP